MIEGAVKNACDAHPGWRPPKHFARSIAKRAAGTLTAQWPEVLAAEPSDNADVTQQLSLQPQSVGPVERNGKGAVSAAFRRPPLQRLHRLLSRKVKPLMVLGYEQKAQAYRKVLKIIGNL